MASWWVEYDLEVANYLNDNGELVADLFFAMEALPESDAFQQRQIPLYLPGIYRVSMAGHRVYFRRDDVARIVSIVTIHPIE